MLLTNHLMDFTGLLSLAMHSILPNRAVVISFSTCYVLLIGCERSQEKKPESNMEFKQSQEEILKSKIETLVAESKHDPSADSSKMRSVCTYCSAWTETDPRKVILLMMQGTKTNSSGEKQKSDVKREDADFFVRHLEQCGKKGGMVKAVYPDEPEWSKLDPKKREN